MKGDKLKDIYTARNLAIEFPMLFDGDSLEDKVVAVRWLVWRRKENGLDAYDVVVGERRNTRIHAPRFLKWLIETAAGKKRPGMKRASRSKK